VGQTREALYTKHFQGLKVKGQRQNYHAT